MTYFHKKYPALYYSLISGIFIFIFLKVFKPFGFQQVPDRILNPLFIGYGLIGFVMVIGNHLALGGLVERHFPDKESVIRAWIWPMWIVITIILVNVVFTRWYFIKTGLSTPEGIRNWPVIIGTLALGMLCVFIIEMIDQNLRLRQNLKTQQLANRKLKERLPEAPGAERTPDEILIPAQNEKDSLRLDTDDLYFLSAEENYVAVHFLGEKLERVLLRNTLSAVADRLKDHYPVLFRCHRGYLVNIRKINSVSGNAQGFRLFLDQVSDPIPVSRRYVAEFRDIVRDHL